MEKVDLTILPEWQQKEASAHLQAWANANEPGKEMSFSGAYWSQITFIRDVFMYKIFADHLVKLEVISTHTSKSIKLPVYKATLKDGTELILRDNMHDWKVSISATKPLYFPKGTFNNDGLEAVGSQYCEGFKDEWVYPSYSENDTQFTVEINNEMHMQLFLYHLQQQLDTKEQTAYLVGIHRYSFKAGEPGRIIGVKFGEVAGLPRLAYQVSWKGEEDLIAIEDSNNYEIITEADMLAGKIPEIVN